MRQLSPEQVGVESRFLTSRSAGRGDPSPPSAACSVLSDFCFLAVPVDMLLCVYRAVGHVHAAAAEVAQVDHNAIGADALLPLLVWAVVHTPLPHVFSALEYAKALSTSEQATSELGYYLATFEAACEYALDAQPPSAHAGGDDNAYATSDAPAPLAPQASSSDGAAHPPLDHSQLDACPPGAISRSSSSVGDGFRPEGLQVCEPPPNVTLAKEVAEREALVNFLQQERAVDELVEALVL